MSPFEKPEQEQAVDGEKILNLKAEMSPHMGEILASLPPDRKVPVKTAWHELDEAIRIAAMNDEDRAKALELKKERES